MQPLDTTPLILALIKQDLKNNKLVLGLTALGLDAGAYHTEINEIVFKLMGFSEPYDDLLETYSELVDWVLCIDDVEKPRALESLAQLIYELLLDEKRPEWWPPDKA